MIRAPFNALAKPILITALAVSTMTPMEPVQAAEATIVQLKDMPKGSIINFAGSQWKVLNPEKGYIIKQSAVTSRSFAAGSKNVFDPSDKDSVAYYLNTTYYQLLPALDRSLIQTKSWTVGNEENEAGASVNAKLGLLSYSEWMNYYKNYDYNMTEGMKLPIAGNQWTRTPKSGEGFNAWYMHPIQKELAYYHSSTSGSIYPTAYLSPQTTIIDGTVEPALEGKEQIQNLSAGKIIEFAGYEWIVLDPATGYILMKNSVGKLPFDPDNTQLFSPTDTNNIAYYLNNTFYNSLPADEKSLIKKSTWTIGNEVNEGNRAASAFVGLISYSEWEKYSKYYSKSKGFLDNPTFNERFWTRTPSSVNSKRVWFPNATGLLDGTNDTSISFAVRPAIKIDVKSLVTDISNQPPDIELQPSEKNVRSDKPNFNTLSLSGNAIDVNSGDDITIKYSINGIEGQSNQPLDSYTSDGTSHEFIKDITVNPSFPEGTHEIRVWAEDNQGGKSAEKTQTLIVDKTGPTINFSNLTDNELKIGDFSPTIQVEDEHGTPTHSVELDGEPYKGNAISGSGEHRLTVDATDEVGNTSFKTINFVINRSPVAKAVEDIGMNKSNSKNFKIEDLFTDAEGDSLKVTAQTDDSTIAKAEVNEQQVIITALKQGSTTIRLKANDGYSDSEELVIKVDVNTRVPKLTFAEEKWKLADDKGTISIAGSVQDEDKEKVTITASLDGKEKSFVVKETTGDQDDWVLQWDAADLPVGVYSSLTVSAEDAYGGHSELVYDKPIVKIKGDKTGYLANVKTYEEDNNVNANDWTLDQHNTLLQAYIAMQELAEENTDTAQKKAEEKVNKLIDGKLKTSFQKAIKTSAFDWLKSNFDKATVSDYLRAGISNINPDDVPILNEKAASYQKDKAVSSKELSQDDVTLLSEIITVKRVAEQKKSVSSYLIFKETVSALHTGSVKSEWLVDINKGILAALSADANQLTENLLTDHFEIEFEAKNLSSYKQYLGDISKEKEETITVDDLKKAIADVDKVKKSVSVAYEKPSSDSIQKFVSNINTLVEGSFKKEQLEKLKEIRLHYFVTQPEIQEIVDYTNLGVTVQKENLEDYRLYTALYIKDKEAKNIKVEDIQKVIDVVDALNAYKANPTDGALTNLIDKTNQLDKAATSIHEQLKEVIEKAILDSINDDLSNVSNSQLINIGIDDVTEENISRYQDAFVEYGKTINPLTVEDIQKVVDAVNKLVEAENNPSKDAFQKALEEINKLKDGPLKDSLISELEKIIVDYIAANPDKVTVADLELINLKNIEESNLDAYKENLQAYQPLTKEKLQQVINVTNQLKITLKQVTKEEMAKFSGLVDGLSESTLKTGLKTVETALEAIQIYEKEASEVKLSEMTETIEHVLTSDKLYMQGMASSLEASMTTALSPTDETVEKAIEKIGTLKEGAFKTRLLNKVGAAFLEYVQKNPGRLTINDLKKAGFERVIEANLDDYIKGLVSLTEETGTLNRETIQGTIDVVNELNKAITSQKLEEAKEAKKWIEKLPESEWKTEKVKEVDTLIKKLTPKPPSSGGGGGGTVTPEPPKDAPSSHIEGEKTNSGVDFSIPSKTIEGAIKGEIGDLVLTEKDNVVIDLPHNAIDFEELYKELGKYGLLIQLIKIDEENYRLSVKAITAEGEKELTNFHKHLKVAMKEENVKTATAASKAGKLETVVLRKNGSTLTSVPHLYEGNTITIKTTRTGHFILVNHYKTFKDISGTFSKNEIEKLATRQIVKGTGGGEKYNPTRSITRAELATMIARAMDLQATRKTTFADTRGQWHKDSVQAVFEAGIVLGKNSETFAPDNAVTRQEAAAMMARALRYAEVKDLPKVDKDTIKQFKDLSEIGVWAREDIALLKELNIMNGKLDGKFEPQRQLTRAEMAKILYGTMSKAKFM